MHFGPDPDSQLPLDVQKAIYLTGVLQQRATDLQTPQERRQQAELDRMMQHPEDKSTLMQITDQAFRARSPYRVADQLTHVLDVQGIPRFFSPLERAALKGFQSFGSYLPGVAVPMVKEYMHRETANVILPAERELLAKHLTQRHGGRRADERQYPGRSVAGGRRGGAPTEALPRRAAASGNRSDLGQDLHDLLADLAAGPATLDRRAGRPPRAALSRRDEEPVSPRGRHGSPQVRLPGHGRVSGHEHHGRSVHEVARPARHGRRRRPGSRCNRTSPTRTARS